MAKSSDEILLQEVLDFLDRTGMGKTEFGVGAIGDRSLVARLQGGASVQLRTADRIDEFMSSYERRLKKNNQLSEQHA